MQRFRRKFNFFVSSHFHTRKNMKKAGLRFKTSVELCKSMWSLNFFLRSKVPDRGDVFHVDIDTRHVQKTAIIWLSFLIDKEKTLELVVSFKVFQRKISFGAVTFLFAVAVCAPLKQRPQWQCCNHTNNFDFLYPGLVNMKNYLTNVSNICSIQRPSKGWLQVRQKNISNELKTFATNGLPYEKHLAIVCTNGSLVLEERAIFIWHQGRKIHSIGQNYAVSANFLDQQIKYFLFLFYYKLLWRIEKNSA